MLKLSPGHACGAAAGVALVVAALSAANADPRHRPTPAPSPAQYGVLYRIAIGGEGGWDYLISEPRAHRVFVSRGDRVDVVDTVKGKVVGSIKNTEGVHGIAIARALGRGFTSNGRADSVTIFNLRTLAEIGRTAVGKNPDAIIYDTPSRRVFTFNGRSDDATALDATTGKVVGTIALDGRPEFGASDGRGHVYVNLEDKSQLLQIDSQSLRITNRWSLAPGEEPAGLAIDRRHRRIFSTCHNGMMVVVDADTGKVVATPPIGRGTDAAAFDPRAQIAFSSNGDGTLTLVHEDTPDTYSVSTVQTQQGARTMALDLRTHRIYLMTAKAAPPAAGQPARWRWSFVPGSAALVVVGPRAPTVAR